MGFAGICVEPAYDVDWNYDADASAELYLSGSGTLQATGGNGDAADGKFGGGAGIGGNGQDLDGGDSVDFGLVCVMESFAGVLYATGGESGSNRDAGRSFGGGAGIGSGGFNMNEYSWNEVFGSIEIHGGTVEARSIGNGAGIGAGGGQGDLDTALSEISIRITGGTITATGGKLGAGIGGGSICDGGRIFISGGKVNAIGGANDGSMGAAGIGGGNDASVWEVSITGGTVHAREAAARPVSVVGRTQAIATSIMVMRMESSARISKGKLLFPARRPLSQHRAAQVLGEAARSTVARESVPGILRAITAAAWHMPSPSRTARPCARWAAFMRKRSAMASGQRILPATALR